MIDDLQTALQAVMNSQLAITVYLNQLIDGSSTGRSGKIFRLGSDYVSINDAVAGVSYLIPFNAITMIVPERQTQ
jgi:hypothetical protein